MSLAHLFSVGDQFRWRSGGWLPGQCLWQKLLQTFNFGLISKMKRQERLQGYRILSSLVTLFWGKLFHFNLPDGHAVPLVWGSYFGNNNYCRHKLPYRPVQTGSTNSLFDTLIKFQQDYYVFEVQLYWLSSLTVFHCEWLVDNGGSACLLIPLRCACQLVRVNCPWWMSRILSAFTLIVIFFSTVSGTKQTIQSISSRPKMKRILINASLPSRVPSQILISHRSRQDRGRAHHHSSCPSIDSQTALEHFLSINLWKLSNLIHAEKESLNWLLKQNRTDISHSKRVNLTFLTLFHMTNRDVSLYRNLVCTTTQKQSLIWNIFISFRVEGKDGNGHSK